MIDIHLITSQAVSLLRKKAEPEQVSTLAPPGWAELIPLAHCPFPVRPSVANILVVVLTGQRRTVNAPGPSPLFFFPSPGMNPGGTAASPHRIGPEVERAGNALALGRW